MGNTERDRNRYRENRENRCVFHSSVTQSTLLRDIVPFRIDDSGLRSAVRKTQGSLRFDVVCESDLEQGPLHRPSSGSAFGRSPSVHLRNALISDNERHLVAPQL